MSSQKPKRGYKLVKSFFGKYEEIPETWELITIDNVTLEHKQGFYTNQNYSKTGIKLVRITDLQNPILDYHSMPLLELSEKDIQDFKVNKGDFLFARSGAIGRFGIATKDIPCVFGSYIIRFVFDSTKILNEYFGYFYQTNFVEKQLNAIQQGSSNININAENIKSIKIKLPPIKEQQKIASILSNINSLIQQTQKIIEHNQRLKKGLMQRLLTKGIGHTKFKKVKWLFGKNIEIPELWEINLLKEVTHKIGDGIHSTPNYVNDSNFYFINGNNLVDGKVVFFGNTKNVSEEEYLTYKLDLSRDTVFLSINGTIGNVAFYNNEKIVLGKSVCYIICNEKLDRTFLFYILQSEYLHKFFNRELTSTTIFNLSLATVRNSPILLPKIEEQQKITSILSNVDSQIQKYQEYKSKFETLKKGLMQKLLTGQIRVKL